MRRRKALPRELQHLGLAAALLVLAAWGCTPSDEGPSVLLEVSAGTPITSLRVLAKRYGEGSEIVIFAEQETRVEAAGVELSRVKLILPEPGRYAFHLIGEPAGEATTRQAATICREVSEGLAFVPLSLGRIEAEHDEDGDTFPEDVGVYCAQMAAEGTPCDVTCNGEDYLALGDCNPPEGLEAPQGCDEVPAATGWNPFVSDQCGDCYDVDCWQGDAPCEDRDGDGYPSDEDCDDEDPEVHPGAPEQCGNGRDENCRRDLEGCTDGDLPCDADNDGHPAIVEGQPDCGTDCDDDDASTSPLGLEGCGADPDDPEACPGCLTPEVDENCNGDFNEGCYPDDIDNDGVRAGADCNDCDSSIGPDRLEVCGDGLDQDCSDEPEGGDLACSPEDQDGDGFEAMPTGADCDDGDPQVYPEAPERCGDGVAQGCARDIPCSEITDFDGDGFGPTTGDCDDGDAAINPWATESCDEDGVDEDCDGQVNEVAPGASGGCGYDPATGLWAPIDFTTEDHCGGCRRRCCASPCQCYGDECVDGECRCNGRIACVGEADSACCPGEDHCVDLTEDPRNCGACGYRCPPNEECRAEGSCGQGLCRCLGEPGEASCALRPGTVCCPGAGCVDLDNDPAHCGSCDNDCLTEADGGPRGDLCVVDERGYGSCHCGEVGAICLGAQWCTAVTEAESCGCRDLTTDERHCGRCDHRCDENERCLASECRCGAEGEDCAGPPGDACCPDAGCVDLLGDAQNCGACGQRCAPGETCQAGECRCGSGAACDPRSQDCCAGVCRSVLNDPNNCGQPGTGEACGHRCEGGADCVDGRCLCPDPTMSDCEGRCDCATGGGQVCCDGQCFNGSCCADAECEAIDEQYAPDCVSHRCTCQSEGEVCRNNKWCCSDGCIANGC